METFLLALRVLLSLAVVLGLLWIVQRRFTRGVRTGRGANPVTVVARQGISAKASVVVVEAEGKRFLLGVTEQSVNVLHAGEVPEDASAAAVFARSMNEALPGGLCDPAPATPSAPATLTSVPTYGFGTGTDGPPARRRTGRRAARPVESVQPQKADPRLGGSILSPDTWKQTVAALRQGRNG